MLFSTLDLAGESYHMPINTSLVKSPVFPDILSLPLKLIPEKHHSTFLVLFLNRFLKQQINEGDLEFLSNKILCVNIKDIGIKFVLSLHNNRLVSQTRTKTCDIEIQASVYDFLQLAARQQDPDTLVFQRRLVMQGNTELGLELKNFLDGLDLESANFARVEKLLLKTLPVYKKLFS